MARGRNSSLQLRERIKEVLLKDPTLTQKQLIERFGCHHRTIADVKKELGQKKFFEKDCYLSRDETAEGYNRFLEDKQLKKIRLFKCQK